MYSYSVCVFLKRGVVSFESFFHHVLHRVYLDRCVMIHFYTPLCWQVSNTSSGATSPRLVTKIQELRPAPNKMKTVGLYRWLYVHGDVCAKKSPDQTPSQLSLQAHILTNAVFQTGLHDHEGVSPEIFCLRFHHENENENLMQLGFGGGGDCTNFLRACIIEMPS